MKNYSLIAVTITAMFTTMFPGCGGGGGKEPAGVNRPPVIDNVALSPLTPNINSEITAQILSHDPDGDPITYKVVWFVNQREVGEGQFLKYETVKKGDVLLAEVTPNDGKTWGSPVKSPAVTVLSSEPRILSVKYTPNPVYANTPQITVDADAEDPDGDTLDLFCNYLVHNKVLPETISILNLAPLNLKKHDTIFASATVDDGSTRSRPFEFPIVISDAPPELQTETEVIKLDIRDVNYPVPITDPDGDRLSFELLKPPPGMTIDKNTGILSGSADENRTIVVTVRATDPEGAYLDAKFTLVGQ